MKNGTFSLNGGNKTSACAFEVGNFHKVAVTLTPDSISAALDGKVLGKSSTTNRDGFYIQMSLDRYVFADVDNFALTA